MSSDTKTASSNSSATLDLQISDPVSMLNEIARRYESTERILMEYVDNALDDAETLFRENGNNYPFEIKIELILDFEAGDVTIRDNCRGMEKGILERIVQNVGESQKRGVTWVNGRFGFGVQAFRAAAEFIRFHTKHQNTSHLVLELHRDQHRGIQGAQATTGPFPSDTGTGTMVTIGAFEEEWFETITVDSIKQEIESHFERLLARPNLSVTVREKDGDPVRCEPFRYREIPGKAIQRVLELKYKGKTYPVEVHLKVADFEVPGRTVRFFARGRRINYVSEIKSFIRKSTFRTSVWGHPHLLGYIEVGEIVRPVITRDDFVRNKGRRVFYEAILNLEQEVKNALDRINEAQRDTTLSRLEDVLQNVLASIARQDRRQLRLHTTRRNTSTKKQPEVEATSSESQQPGANGRSAPAELAETTAAEMPAAGAAEFQGLEERPTAPTPGPDDEVKFSYNVEKSQNETRPRRRRRNAFDIQFFEIPPDAEGQVKRSYLVDSTIYINVAHPDFQERMTYTRLGQPRVTERLGAYIAATVSIHYKDQFYARYGHMPDRRDLLFDEQVDFIFRLESALREHLPALEKELARQRQPEMVAA